MLDKSHLENAIEDLPMVISLALSQMCFSVNVMG